MIRTTVIVEVQGQVALLQKSKLSFEGSLCFCVLPPLLWDDVSLDGSTTGQAPTAYKLPSLEHSVMTPEHRLRQCLGKQNLSHTESRGEVEVRRERGKDSSWKPECRPCWQGLK